MAIIDAKNLVFGRMASIVAERALKGEKIDIVNAEQCVIIGSRETVIGRLKRKLGMHGKANPEKGPKYPRTPDRILRNAVRHMMPAEKERGRKGLKRVRVFIGIPKALDGQETETIGIASYNGKEDAVKLGEASKSIGWKG